MVGKEGRAEGAEPEAAQRQSKRSIRGRQDTKQSGLYGVLCADFLNFPEISWKSVSVRVEMVSRNLRCSC